LPFLAETAPCPFEILAETLDIQYGRQTDILNFNRDWLIYFGGSESCPIDFNTNIV
jgi:hypothetical protein